MIENIVSVDKLQSSIHSITWCNDKNLHYLSNFDSTNVVIINQTISDELKSSLNCIISDNPRRTFQEILSKHFVKPRKNSISPSANIESPLGLNPFIGSNVVIEENCVIGNNVSILHNTVILNGTVIGDNVSIGSNNTVGGIGFGYEKNEQGEFEIIPHLGNVIIGNNVDIGNNTCIDRAVLGSTIINDNVKVDNLVHIAHGVEIGSNSVIIANAMIAGSVNIGRDSWIAPSSSVLNKLEVGDNSLVGLGAVVLKNVESNSIVAGNPAKFIRKNGSLS